MRDARKPLLGAAIAAGLAFYAAAAERRERGRSLLERAGNGERGRLADTPQQINAPGWRDILARVFADISNDNVSLMAAGIAFYALLSVAPAFTALVALYGLIADPAAVQAQVASLEGVLPPEARALVSDQLTAIVQAHTSSLSVGFVISMLLSLWSANSGTSALISALNVAYGENEKRNLLRYYGGALLLTFCGIIFGLVSLVLVAIIPAVIGWLPLGEVGRWLVGVLRWPLLLILFAAGLSVVYRYAPSRTEARWSWVSWGAGLATLLWIAGSVLFSLYVDRFATYNKVYGSLGAVVVLLMWLWLSAYAVLLGAELNAEMEHQTAKDTTRRPEKPMGKRGAFVADTLARS